MEALESEAKRGGAIRKPRKKSPKKDNKIMEALATKVGGRFHDRKHKYLSEKLTGRGGRLDSPECRRMMHDIMQHHHPALWNSYVKGKTRVPQKFMNDELRNTSKGGSGSYDVLDRGGSLLAVTHSENGYLQSHDNEFHHMLEVV